jgi:galactosylceramidase
MCFTAMFALLQVVAAVNLTELADLADLRDVRTFDGVGALSGGGATSKLLFSYPEPQQTQILDTLFKPNFGASLQILKVEIGGDACSTEGSESSHMHSKHDLSCSRGYEWQLMKEAKKRNPGIVLYGLPWGFPNWLGTPDNQNALTNNGGKDTANYIVNWINCANQTHGLTIDVIGVWNEMDDQFKEGGVAYLKLLRTVLDARGYTEVKIIAGDVHSWAPSAEVLTDSALAKVVDILCRHYPSTKSDPAADQTGKPLWSSEDYAADNTGAGGRCQGRILNQNFVNGNMTATISWNLISSYYSWLQWANDGLMMARTPWSGHYSVSPPIWAIAHTAQFAKRGWAMLPVGMGSGTLAQGGTFVTYVDGGKSNGTTSKTAGEFAMVIEKISPAESGCGFSATPHYTVSNESVSFKIPTAMHHALIERQQVGEGAVTLVVWRSNYARESFFAKDAEGITVAADGTFTVSITVDDLLTVASPTTGEGATKGTFPNIPTDTISFPGTFTADFDGPEFVLQAEAPYFAQMTGSFEVHASSPSFRSSSSSSSSSSSPGALSPHGQTLRQNASGYPVKWLRDDILPYTQIGDNKWADANVSADVLIEESGSVYIATRWVGSDTHGAGYLFGLDVDKQAWYLAPSIDAVKAASGKSGDASKYLAHGSMAITLNTWYSLALTIADSSVSGAVDGKQVFGPTAIPQSTKHGNAALGAGQYNHVQFDNVAIRATQLTPGPSPGPGPGPKPGPPAPPAPTKCDDPVSGTAVHVRGCEQDPKDRVQAWTFNGNQNGVGTISLAAKGFTDLCLHAEGAGCAGKCVSVGDCATAPKWRFDATTAKKIVLVSTDEMAAKPQCLDVDMRPGGGASYDVDLYTCNDAYEGGKNQQFDYDEATGIISSALFNSMSTCVMAC